MTKETLLLSTMVALLAVFTSLFFFSPRLLVFTEEAPGSYEWARGLNFLDQLSGHPLEKIEPALRHRLLPVYAARLLGLHGYAAFALGWAGAVALLVYVQFLLDGLGLSRRTVVAAVFILASSSAVITSFGWLGIFDCWWLLGLIITAFSPRVWVVGMAAALAPWIDERFFLGLPVAFVARWLVYSYGLQAARSVVTAITLGLMPYLAWRLHSFISLPGDASANFLSLHFLVWVSMVPHGWWMAYRLGWAVIALCFLLPNASGVKPWLMITACAFTAVPAIVTAADVSRSAMVLGPLVVGGVILAWRQSPDETSRWLPRLAAANFLVPFIHVVYNKLQAVNPLPWEIIRLFKKLGQ
jgi:hypothetical protein